MKSFDIPCEVGGQRATFRVHVGRPTPGLPPLKYQAAWLWETRRGRIDSDVLETFDKLLTFAREHGISHEELCAQTFGKKETS